MSRNRSLVILLAVSLLSVLAPRADATVWTGVCTMSLSFSFDTPIKSTASLTGPNYDVFAGDARDLNPLASGMQGCAVDTSALSPFRSTSASGAGHSILWTCDQTTASGSWEQTWDPDPPSVTGAHTITGTWGQWTMVVNSPSLNFTGVMDLTLDPSFATTLAQCELGGIYNLRMIGVMHFQDPVVD
jgi:hypothetical protein